MTRWSAWKSRISTVLMLAALNVALAELGGAPGLAALQRAITLGREIVKDIEAPQGTVDGQTPTLATEDPVPTTVAAPPCFVTSTPQQAPTQGCTIVWAVQLFAYENEYRGLAVLELDELHREGLRDLALMDSGEFPSLCPDHLLIMQPTFGSQEEATAAAPFLATQANVGRIDVVPLSADATLSADCN